MTAKALLLSCSNWLRSALSESARILIVILLLVGAESEKLNSEGDCHHVNVVLNIVQIQITYGTNKEPSTIMKHFRYKSK